VLGGGGEGDLQHLNTNMLRSRQDVYPRRAARPISHRIGSYGPPFRIRLILTSRYQLVMADNLPNMLAFTRKTAARRFLQEFYECARKRGHSSASPQRLMREYQGAASRASGAVYLAPTLMHENVRTTRPHYVPYQQKGEVDIR